MKNQSNEEYNLPATIHELFYMESNFYSFYDNNAEMNNHQSMRHLLQFMDVSLSNIAEDYVDSVILRHDAFDYQIEISANVSEDGLSHSFVATKI